MTQILFQTERLTIQPVSINDQNEFIELLSHPDIINMVPQPILDEQIVSQKFQDAISFVDNFLIERVAWGVYETPKSDLIGLALYLTDKNGQREIGYRFRPPFWGKGYGYELCEGLIRFCFEKLNYSTLTANASHNNIGSMKILSKYMVFSHDQKSDDDSHLERHFILHKEHKKS